MRALQRCAFELGFETQPFTGHLHSAPTRPEPLHSTPDRKISPHKPEELRDLPTSTAAADSFQRSQVQIPSPLPYVIARAANHIRPDRSGRRYGVESGAEVRMVPVRFLPYPAPALPEAGFAIGQWIGDLLPPAVGRGHRACRRHSGCAC